MHKRYRLQLQNERRYRQSGSAIKRLGDGFYEQKLIREQVAELTGRRFLVGYADDEAQFKALMNNGITSAKAFNLTAGIALSASQIAQLTSDIVWLVQQTVTRPDGSTTQALVPQVYVSVKAGDLNSNGQLLSGQLLSSALISADSVHLNLTGDLNNSNGTIAGRTVLALNANNINNLGGRLTATDVNVHANNDLNNLGGTIDASNSLIASAGHDLNVISSTSTQSNATGSRTNINRVAGLYITGDASLPITGLPSTGLLIASAGHDLHLDGAQIVNNATGNTSSNTGNSSQTTLQAGHDVSLGTIKTSEQNNITWNSKNHLNQGSSIDNGTQIQSNGDISIYAGHDANLKAANISSGDSNSKQGDLSINAANNINISTGQTSTNSVGNTTYGYGTTASTASALKQAGSSLSAGNNLSLQSGNDTHITSANLNAGNNLDVAATGNLTIDAAKDSSQLDYAYKAKNKRDIIKNLDETVVASNLNAGKHINLTAAQAASQSVTPTTGGKLTLNSANINSQTGAVALNAAQDVTIGTTAETHDHYAEHYTKTKSLLSSKSTLTIDQSHSSDAIGSSVSGETITVNAGKDIAVQGSNVVSTHATNLSAGGNVNIESVQNTDNESHFKETKQSGFSTSGASISLGKSQLTTTNDTQSVTNTASTVGSVQGNTNITAGKAYTQTGSDILTPAGDINISAQSVTIQNATDTAAAQQTMKYRQSGITLAVTSPIISAIQTAQQMATAASQTKDSRMQLLAAGTAALTASNAKDALGKVDQFGNIATAGSTGADDLTHVREANATDQVGGINVSISIGSSKSNSNSQTTSTTAASSHLNAGGNINITATGAGQASDINVIGSQIKAKDDITLKAEDQINLQAAQNVDTLNSTNKSSSSSIGASISSTGGITGNLAMSKGRGSANGQDITYTETIVQGGNNAGDKVTLNSGADSNIIGSQVIGNQVIANVGTNPALGGTGNLNIQSLQDSSTYQDKQSSSGISVSVPLTGAGSVGGSINASKSSTKSNYQSVSEQAGIFAGNGGFQVNVNGNTDLKGAVIASSEQAANSRDANGNPLNQITIQTLTTSNIENSAEYKASSTSLGLGYSNSGSGVSKDQSGKPTTGASSNSLLPSLNGFSATTPVALSASDSANSTTVSGISGGSVSITNNALQQQNTGNDTATTVAMLNRDVQTQLNTSIDANGNAVTTAIAVDSNGNNAVNTLTPIYTEETKQQIQAGFAIVGAFNNEVGTFLTNRAKEAETAQHNFDNALANGASNEELTALAQHMYDAQKWLPSGTYNTITTAFVGALSGNVTGSTSQMIQGAAVNYLQSLAVNEVKHIADNLQSETARAALQAVVGCAGAAASGNNCGTGAISAASAVVLSNLLDTLANQKVTDLSASEQLARRDLLLTIITGISGNLGADARAALTASQLEIENNQLGKNREVQTAMGYMLGVGASVGSLGLVATPEFWQGMKLIKDSEHPLNLLALALKTEAITRGQDFNMFINQDDMFGAGMVTGRSVTDTIMIADAVGSLAVIATKVAVAGGRLVINGTTVVLKNGKLEVLTAESTANSATVTGLKNQLAIENLANIASQDVRLAAAANGDVAMGAGTVAEANKLGMIWVGDGAKLVDKQASCSGCWISADGTRLYRPPTTKLNTPAEYNPTGVQANFVTQQLNTATGKWVIQSNSHLVVKP